VQPVYVSDAYDLDLIVSEDQSVSEANLRTFLEINLTVHSRIDGLQSGNLKCAQRLHPTSYVSLHNSPAFTPPAIHSVKRAGEPVHIY